MAVAVAEAKWAAEAELEEVRTEECTAEETREVALVTVAVLGKVAVEMAAAADTGLADPMAVHYQTFRWRSRR